MEAIAQKGFYPVWRLFLKVHYHAAKEKFHVVFGGFGFFLCDFTVIIASTYPRFLFLF